MGENDVNELERTYEFEKSTLELLKQLLNKLQSTLKSDLNLGVTLERIDQLKRPENDERRGEIIRKLVPVLHKLEEKIDQVMAAKEADTRQGQP
jgi:hypothetical protein